MVVMVLSPRMVQSFAEWPRLRDAAAKAGFTVVSLRDPAVSDAEWTAAAKAAHLADALKLPQFSASAMLEAGPLNHFPTSYVYLADRVHPWPILGVMPDAVWVALLLDRLAQLRETQ